MMEVLLALLPKMYISIIALSKKILEEMAELS